LHDYYSIKEAFVNYSSSSCSIKFCWRRWCQIKKLFISKSFSVFRKVSCIKIL